MQRLVLATIAVAALPGLSEAQESPTIWLRLDGTQLAAFGSAEEAARLLLAKDADTPAGMPQGVFVPCQEWVEAAPAQKAPLAGTNIPKFCQDEMYDQIQKGHGENVWLSVMNWAQAKCAATLPSCESHLGAAVKVARMDWVGSTLKTAVENAVDNGTINDAIVASAVSPLQKELVRIRQEVDTLRVQLEELRRTSGAGTPKGPARKNP